MRGEISRNCCSTATESEIDDVQAADGELNGAGRCKFEMEQKRSATMSELTNDETRPGVVDRQYGSGGTRRHNCFWQNILNENLLVR